MTNISKIQPMIAPGLG